MQVSQQTTDIEQTPDQALTEAVQEALMMAEFFHGVGRGEKLPDLIDKQLSEQLQVAEKQVREVIGIAEFEILNDGKIPRPT
ncbi:MAG: hypothetical protein GY943_14925 [Chloroflexi bacterium]|nr:hypothetical protein [Chloroflexota bacterium]